MFVVVRSLCCKDNTWLHVLRAHCSCGDRKYLVCVCVGRGGGRKAATPAEKKTYFWQSNRYTCSLGTASILYVYVRFSTPSYSLALPMLCYVNVMYVSDAFQVAGSCQQVVKRFTSVRIIGYGSRHRDRLTDETLDVIDCSWSGTHLPPNMYYVIE